MASAKTDAEAEGAAQKRLDNLMNGTLRASPVREGNPVRARAMELALEAVMKHSAFIAMCQKAGIKTSHKDAVKKAREQAAKWVAVDGNKFTALAEKQVADAKANAAEVGELDITL
jgi:galactose-1-phosphate uridylyltransferase